jgi:phospholipid-transporting ATPase
MSFVNLIPLLFIVVPERSEEGDINYQATSPDEGALVRGAAKNGFVFYTRKPTEIAVDTVHL